MSWWWWWCSSFPGGTSGKIRFDPWVGKIPWSRKRQPTPVFLPGEFNGQKSLVGYSSWGREVRHDWAAKHTQRAGKPGDVTRSNFPAHYQRTPTVCVQQATFLSPNEHQISKQGEGRESDATTTIDFPVGSWKTLMKAVHARMKAVASGQLTHVRACVSTWFTGGKKRNPEQVYRNTLPGKKGSWNQLTREPGIRRQIHNLKLSCTEMVKMLSLSRIPLNSSVS